MKIYELSKAFPTEEVYSLTDQIRRASRSISGQIAEGWKRRKYEAAFVNKMNEAEGEAAETQVWLEYAVKCGYINRDDGTRLHKKDDDILGKLISMGNYPSGYLDQESNSNLVFWFSRFLQFSLCRLHHKDSIGTNGSP